MAMAEALAQKARSGIDHESTCLFLSDRRRSTRSYPGRRKRRRNLGSSNSSQRARASQSTFARSDPPMSPNNWLQFGAARPSRHAHIPPRFGQGENPVHRANALVNFVAF